MKPATLKVTDNPKIASEHMHRIGQAARNIGVTTRTLRYWQELGLIAPSGHRDGSERLYNDQDINHGLHILELKTLFGFSLAEIKAIVDTEATLASIKSEYHTNSDEIKRRELTKAALSATQTLLERIDDKAHRIKVYRDELAAKVGRLENKLK